MSDTGATAAIMAVMLILPIAALVGRRVPWRTLAGMGLAWVAIFAVGLVLVSWVGGRGGPVARDGSVSGGEARIAIAADGHFWVDATIDGVARRMLVDTGATTTAISLGTARAAGLDLAESPFAVSLQTANGPVAASRATIASLRIGPIRAAGLPVVVSDRFGTTDVLGMNFLSRLSAWRVEGSVLVLVA